MSSHKSCFRFCTVMAIVFGAARALAIEPATPLSDSALQPWTATVWTKGTSGALEHQCGASVIDRWWVLTARHCVVDLCDANVFGTAEVRVGYRLDEVKRFAIQKVVCHPGNCKKEGAPAHCDQKGVRRPEDIALIHVGRIFGSDEERPILGTSSLTLTAQGGDQHTRFIAVGWSDKNGQDEKIKPRPSAHTIELVPLPESRCEQLLKDTVRCSTEPLRLGTTQFCAWSAASQPPAFYGLQKGDSGGPLVQKTSGRLEVVGIASAACPKSGLTIFEDVARYRGWIIETICSYYSDKLGAKEAEDCRRRLRGPGA